MTMTASTEKPGRREIPLAVYLVPSAALLLAIFGFPLVESVITAFQENKGVRATPTWTGFANFERVFTSPIFWRVFAQTVVWTVAVVAATTIVSYVLASLLQEKFRGKRLFQIILMLPWATSIALSAVVWRFGFQPGGLINRTLELVGLDEVAWLADTPEAAFALIFVGVWVSVPFTTVMLSAGMRSIPNDIYEAVALETNSVVSKHWHVTLPMVRTVLLIVTLANFVLVFNSFPIIFVMTEGGPVNKTDILATLLYKQAFTFLDFGAASALAVVVLAILLGAAVWYVHTLIHAGKKT